MHRRRLSWSVGGIGLIACGVVGIIRGSVLGAPGATTTLTLLADVLWAGAVLILAFGLSREGSVVARKPLGVASSAAVALWPLTDTLVGLFAGPMNPEQAEAWLPWSYLSMVLPLMVGLIAGVQVARTRVVPTPWNWAPLWALGAQTLMWVLPQLIGVASPTAFMEMSGVLAALGTLAFLTATLGLGILAIMLSSRSRTGTVTVFPSSAPE
ncbi:hypothetical protein [Microbacterium sp. LWH12-1.2]|uniref:hypothetical protein n=1 Tax=Microbacterium sp. LWH12-1.2 TaxID=3135259 RepID=UPI003419CD92